MLFKGTAHYYIYITLLQNPKDECTFRFSNVLIIGLNNSSPNFWFGIFLLLIADLFPRVAAPLEVLVLDDFYDRIFKGRSLWYLSYSEFSVIFKASSRNALTETIKPGRFLKSP